MGESKTTAKWAYCTTLLSNRSRIKQKLQEGYEPFCVDGWLFTRLHMRKKYEVADEA